MLRLIISCAAIMVFFALFGFARGLSIHHDNVNSENYSSYNEFLITHAGLLQEHKNLLLKYKVQMDDAVRMKKIVREYGVGYFGMYQYLKKQGKTDKQIKEIIKENSQGLVLEED